ALGEKITAADGAPTATSVAKMLLISSLSTAETPLRGLTDGELVESLVDPLLEVSEIKTASSRLQGQAWYLFLGVDQPVFFGPTANVTAEITEIAANIKSRSIRRSETSCRKCSSPAGRRSTPIKWQSCPLLMKSISTMTD